MVDTGKKRIALGLVIGFAVLSAILVGVITGLALASIENSASVTRSTPNENALPTQVLDRNGRLITQFFSEENRALIAIEDMPRHLVFALITREDQGFFEHRGFSIQGTARAAWNILLGRYVSGGSTLTQQLAGHLYADRQEFSLVRKLRELWWALQLERSLSKYEILERYLNTMYFGHGAYGIEAAAQYYFGHSAVELSVAESVMLVIQLASPSLYSPIRRPNEARRMQRAILDRMVELGFADSETVDRSYDNYWANYDFTRASTSSAFFDREDRAPYFSEYVRYRLENELLLGSIDINREGLVVHTTLDLDHQLAAQEIMQKGIEDANIRYRSNTRTRTSYGDELIPMVDMLSLAFDIDAIHVGDSLQTRRAREYYQTQINPLFDVVALMFGVDERDEARNMTREAYVRQERDTGRTTVQGALVAVENETGHLTAMVGGSGFETQSQFNRAVDARVLPGSAFKPLYYAAALDKRSVTPATMIYDSPTVFWNEDGTSYTPLNYRGEWHGPVLVRDALANSMNVPSLRVLQRVGFNDALNIAARLLGIPESSMAQRNLVRRYPVGLGIVSVAPIEMARAFATIANGGRAVEPIAIRYIEDRNGRIILEHERAVRLEQRRRREEEQIISPQTAYIMTNILTSSVTDGTLRFAEAQAGGFTMPTAGKTGTTQNWSDAWTVGYTPYLTTAVWLGFDRGGGNSLGTNQTGAVTAGPLWGRFMKVAHEGLEPREFIQPATGLNEVTVARRSGLLPPENYRGETREELFLSGTAPREFDTMEQFQDQQTPVLVDRLRSSIDSRGYSLSGTRDLASMDLDLNLSLDLQMEIEEPRYRDNAERDDSFDDLNFELETEFQESLEDDEDDGSDEEDSTEDDVWSDFSDMYEGNPLLD